MKNKENFLTPAQVRNKTMLSLFFLLVFFSLCIAGWKWLQKQPEQDGALKPLRSALDANESIFTSFFGNSLAKTYSREDVVSRVRVNGFAGIRQEPDSASWKLQLIKIPGDTINISLDELKALPKTEITFDFKCIEGWSQVTNWGGVRFSDFIRKYGLEAQAALRFTGMHTPDGEYYVGLDNKSMMHPQTLLCYEMNGKPLPINNGYPLRLIIPVKYGVKNIKRIGTIFFSDQRPPDYWHERGYDYYCGL
jgi:DMSO/TMAO reductase YedYZ molybdopterin-dependent catalytic subunit